MLSPDRKHYVTGSQAYRIMADFKKELNKPPEPDFDYRKLADYIRDNGKPLVRDLKDTGISSTGAQIDAVTSYIKSLVPIFSYGMKSVALEIAMYNFMCDGYEKENITTPAMQHGIDTELEAVTALEHKLGLNFTNTGEDQQFLTSGFLGVTPDAIEYDSFDIKSCGEIKCPQAETHMFYIANIRTQEDLLKYKPEYYWQCMCGLAVTNAESYHWASFHPGFNDEYKLVYCEVTPNMQHIDILKRRAERIAKKVPEIIEDIKLRY